MIRFTGRLFPAATRTFALIACVLALYAQDPRGVISGRVVDSSGALVPGANVRVKNLETGVSTAAISNADGNYQVQYLLPGSYSLNAESTSFKQWSRPRLEVRAGDKLVIDVRLQVGDVTESVTVSAETPVLDSASASIAHVFESHEVSGMPAYAGNIAYLIALAPGSFLGRMPESPPWAPGASDFAMAGAVKRGADFNLDGVSNNASAGNASMFPPADMVQEIQVVTAAYDASVGHSASGSVNIALKSGTNQVRGSVSFDGTGGPMMTRDFFTNRFIFDPTTGPITPEKIAANTPDNRWLRTSAAVGGPVYLPRIYDGRQKTFWMFGFQWQKKDSAFSNLQTVPQPVQREGDLSQLLALGAQYQIYDPLTTVSSGSGRFRRSPFLNNVIAAARVDPIARKIIGYYPSANSNGTADGLQNYTINSQNPEDVDQQILRLDHNFSDRNRTFVRYSQVSSTGKYNRLIPGSLVSGNVQERPHHGLAIDHVSTLSPTAVLDVRYGFTQWKTDLGPLSVGWDLKEFGFPDAFISQLDAQRRGFPVVSVSNLLSLGQTGGNYSDYYSHSLLTVLSLMKGTHSFKFGGDFRMIRQNGKTYGNVSPALSFASTYTNGPLDNAAAAPGFAQGLASLLLGIPSSGGVDLNNSVAQSDRFVAGFVQDDWRVNSKLTLNIGLRWEYEGPPSERFNRTSRQFDSTVANPIQAQAQAQYALAPLPQLPADRFYVRGGITFAGVGGNPRGIRDPSLDAFMPRFGFAYQLTPKIVMRGGYGIFFDLLGSEATSLQQPGFSQRTSLVSSLDNGQTYVASISNPFPFGLQKPTGAAGGLTTFLGQSPGFFSPDGRRPYTQRWSQSMQFAVAKDTVVEVGYLGSRSVRLRVTTQLNPVPRGYLSTSSERDQATINLLSAQAANPFVGIQGFAGSALYNATTTSVSQLLKPYLQYTGLSTDLPAGSSWYHGMTLRFQRRLSQTLRFAANYTWSKNMQAISYLNDTDPRPEHVISSMDRTHVLAINGMYEFPFGRGHRFAASLPALLNGVIGGWNLSATYQLQSGGPIAFGNVLYRGDIHAITLPRNERSPARWFNTASFERLASKQLASNIRTFPSSLSSVRTDGISLLNLAVHKEFPLRERLKVELRGEAAGAMNHPVFDVPNTDPTSSLFGSVSRTLISGAARRVWVGVKLLF